jgi:hypothetical protein
MPAFIIDVNVGILLGRLGDLGALGAQGGEIALVVHESR